MSVAYLFFSAIVVAESEKRNNYVCTQIKCEFVEMVINYNFKVIRNR